MSQHTAEMKAAADALYANEGGWHVMTRKHGGGPAWRWKQAGCLHTPKPNWLNNQSCDLAKVDYLPQFLSSILESALANVPSSGYVLGRSVHQFAPAIAALNDGEEMVITWHEIA